MFTHLCQHGLRSLVFLLGVLLIGSSSPSPAATPDVTPRRVTFIPPGTVIDKENAPRGWTHFMLKSQPRLGAGDVEKVPQAVRDLTEQFFTAMLARVKVQTGDSKTYVLDEVAVGLGMHIGPNDVIITPETQSRLGANLGLLGRTALRRGVDKLNKVKVISRSDTMVVIDGPARLLKNGTQRPVIMRYAVLLDPARGRLETLLWAIETDDSGDFIEPFGVIEWLAPRKIEERILHVDSSRFTLGLVNEDALAQTRLYKGQKQLSLADVKDVAGSARLTKESAVDLEKKLWALIHAAEKK